MTALLLSDGVRSGLRVDTPEFAGELEDLVRAVHEQSIPIGALRLGLICRQLVQQLDGVDGLRAGTAAVLASWLVELRTRGLLVEAERLRAWTRADRFHELAAGGGVIFVQPDDGVDVSERDLLRLLRLQRERSILQELVATVEAREIEHFDGAHVLLDEAPPIYSVGIEEQAEPGVPVDELVARLRAAARTLPAVDWHTVPDLIEEIRNRVYREGTCYFESFYGEERGRGITAFLALLELVRVPTRELADGGGVIFVGVKVEQLSGGRMRLAAPWIELPQLSVSSSRPRHRLSGCMVATSHSEAAPLVVDELDGAFEKIETLFGRIATVVGLALSKVRSRAELAAALGIH